MKTLIIILDGLEECEALVTYDLLYRAGIEVDLVSNKEEITSSHNVTIKTHKLFDQIDYRQYDCLVLPGGMPGTKHLEENETVQEMIDYFVKENKLIAAICAAPSILLHKGLLENDKFICFPGFESGYKPKEDVKCVKDNNFITAKGLGAAFEFSYAIISTLLDEEKAKEVLSKTQFY